jgi:replicative DNA helicase
MDLLEAARDLLRRGFAPIPVPRGQKRPVIEGWPSLRLQEADLAKHFKDSSNIGALTGEPSGGLTDIDLDCDEAVRLADAFLPQTPMWSGRAARPRSHVWFRITDGLPNSATFKDIDNETVLVELRANGRQTLVPPSLHPDGDRYEWHGALEPAEVAGDELARTVHTLAAACLLVRHWPKVPGSRHEIANALAGMLLRGGWAETDAAHLIGEVARTAGDDEARTRARDAIATARTLGRGGRATGGPTLARLLDERVVDRVREWLGVSPDHDPAGQQWEPPAEFHRISVPEFPVEVLPSWLSEFVAAEAQATQTPPALAGGLVLAACAVALAGRTRVQIRPGWEEPTNIFSVVVLDPGNRKSAVFSDTTLPILDFEREEAKRLEPEIEEAESQQRLLISRLKHLEGKAAKANKPADRDRFEREARETSRELKDLVVPLRPRLFADDVTPEKLAVLLHDHGGRFAVLSAEGGVFELLAGRYSATGSPNFDIFLKGHAGDPLRVDRIDRTSDHIDRPALTVGLAIQHDVLRGLIAKPGFRRRGLLARFIFVLPTSPVGLRQTGPPPVPGDIRQHYHRNLSSLLRRGAQKSDYLELLRFSSEADARLREFETWLEPQLARDGELGGIADWASKLAGAVARFAGILHAAKHVDIEAPWGRPVALETVERAITLGNFYLIHARAAFAAMGADPEVERAEHVLSWIRRRHVSEFSERNAYQGMKGRFDFKKVEDLRPAIALLEQHGYIRRQSSPEQQRGRPRGPIYEVNPLFGDTGCFGEGGQDLHSDLPSTYEDSAEQKEGPKADPQYPHNPQNSPDALDDEGVV